MLVKSICKKILLIVKLLIYRLKLPRRVRMIRKKAKINVLFVVSEVASWKSEMLYITMLRHPRFSPVIGVSTSYTPPNTKNTLIEYLERKNYTYIDLDLLGNSIDSVSPDIIFYYKPYETCYSAGCFFNKNLRYVFCGMDYCFSVTKHEAHINKPYFNYCWLYFTEHEDIAKRRRELLGYLANNVRVTGVPMQDILLSPKCHFPDPWIDNTGKKRIIYAPHHSIKGTNGDGIEFATFLDCGEQILNLAVKYQDQITIAFKPHPNLYLKLVDFWGQEKADNYYNQWKSLTNTQLEIGEYVGLFKYSDAIIHDSASFIVEYLYINKPAMYLVADTNNVDDMFDFVRDGYMQYVHGKNISDVEKFIKDVINDIDIKKEFRRDYINCNLLPPNNKTACDNIISEVLGLDKNHHSQV